MSSEEEDCPPSRAFASDVAWKSRLSLLTLWNRYETLDFIRVSNTWRDQAWAPKARRFIPHPIISVTVVSPAVAGHHHYVAEKTERLLRSQFVTDQLSFANTPSASSSAHLQPDSVFPVFGGFPARADRRGAQKGQLRRACEGDARGFDRPSRSSPSRERTTPSPRRSFPEFSNPAPVVTRHPSTHIDDARHQREPTPRPSLRQMASV